MAVARCFGIFYALHPFITITVLFVPMKTAGTEVSSRIDDQGLAPASTRLTAKIFRRLPQSGGLVRVVGGVQEWRL